MISRIRFTLIKMDLVRIKLYVQGNRLELRKTTSFISSDLERFAPSPCSTKISLIDTGLFGRREGDK
jgi:hypothetical protein